VKNNKIDSDILDDNYFPEEKSQFSFFKNHWIFVIQKIIKTTLVINQIQPTNFQ